MNLSGQTVYCISAVYDDHRRKTVVYDDHGRKTAVYDYHGRKMVYVCMGGVIRETRLGLQCQTPLWSYPLSLFPFPFSTQLLVLGLRLDFDNILNIYGYSITS